MILGVLRKSTSVMDEVVSRNSLALSPVSINAYENTYRRSMQINLKCLHEVVIAYACEVVSNGHNWVGLGAWLMCET